MISSFKIKLSYHIHKLLHLFLCGVMVLGFPLHGSQLQFEKEAWSEQMVPKESSNRHSDSQLKWQIHWTSDVDNQARCLDGTPAAFYTSSAPVGSQNADKWIISLMWGGWCSLDVPIDWRDEHTVDHCYHHSFTYKASDSVQAETLLF